MFGGTLLLRIPWLDVVDDVVVFSVWVIVVISIMLEGVSDVSTFNICSLR